MDHTTWSYWLSLYLDRWCTGRIMSSKTIAAYRNTLKQFRDWAEVRWPGRGPERIVPVDVLEYVQHLRGERRNGHASVNRTVTILKCFYRAMVSLRHLAPRDNPLADFPKMKAPPRKLPEVLTLDEVKRLLTHPGDDTVLGLRDRALLTILYGTGIRASECSGLDEKDVDLDAKKIRVTGKGGHEREVPLNILVVQALAQYRSARGIGGRDRAFFMSRKARRMSRNAIYERVRTHGRKAGLPRRISPHRLRHTFATHMVRAGVNIVVLRDLLGHRTITSTQIYIHMTAHDLRQAAEAHPIKDLVASIKDLLPGRKIPYQWPAGSRKFG